MFAAGGTRSLVIDVPSARPGPVSRLTRCERDVAELLGCGHSNRGIAQRLFVSERTVDNHVHHILNKLGFDSRVQIATWLARNEHLN